MLTADNHRMRRIGGPMNASSGFRLAVVAIWVGCVVAALPAAAQSGNPQHDSVGTGEVPRARQQELERLLVGRWVVSVGAQERTRQLIIRGFTQAPSGLALDALYGWSDNEPVAIAGRVSEDQAAPTLQFTNQAKSDVTVKPTGKDRWVGKMLTAGGKTHAVSMRRIGADTAVTVSNTPVATFESMATPSASEIEEAIYGSWIVTVGAQERVRTINLRTVEQTTEGLGSVFTVEATHGRDRRNDSSEPVTGVAAVDRGMIKVKIELPLEGTIEASPVSRDRMIGKLLRTDGRTSRVVFTLEGAELAANISRSAVKDLTLIYINAGNCPKCSSWWNAAGGRPADSQQSFLATPEGRAVKFRQINVASWTSTGDPNFWPEDLRWVCEATYVQAGSPRFILIANDQVIANRIGLKQIEKHIMPAIRRVSPRL